MTRTMVFVVAFLAMGFGSLGAFGCSDDSTVTDDGGTDGTEDGEGGADGDADGDGEASCVPACDTTSCEECVAGSCVNTCTTGETCDGMGTCVTGPMTLGGPCAADADCASGMCFTEYTGWPGGFCTTPCDDTPCAVGVCVPTSDAGSFCAPDCSSTDCRPGYSCQALETGEESCWADCTEDWQCTTTTFCEIVEDQGWCSCPAGQHINEDITACLYDDCTYLACDTLHRECNATGGCSGACAACGACDPSTYVLSENHCYPAGAAWGGACTTDADCPGTGVPGRDTICSTEGHGNCQQIDGPDFAVEGSPCTGDPGSVSVSIPMLFWVFNYCLEACTTNADCPAGLICETGGSTGDIQYCWPVGDCTTAADCNDLASELYCSADGSCYVNACLPNPCISVTNSTGECANVAADFRCVCDPGNVWNGETDTCDVYTCPAIAATLGSTTTGDTCTGTNQYNAAGAGPSCTRFRSTGQELVYGVEVPGGSMVVVSMLSTGATTFDNALWATTMCEDIVGALCVAGADSAATGEAEEIAIINRGATAATYYVIADAYSGCGTITLDVGAAEPPAVCGDGTLFPLAGEVCDDGNTAAGDGCSTTCTVEFGYTCDTASPTVCTSYPRIGVFAPGATIPPQTGGPLADGESALFVIEFSAPVLLDGSVAATGTTPDPDVYISNAGGSVAVHEDTGTTETWTGDSLAAGIYMIEVMAYAAVPSFTMTLTARTP